MATCEKIKGKLFPDDASSLCGKPAVIRYDGRNLCAECADENVLAVVRWIEQHTDPFYRDVEDYPDTPDNMCDCEQCLDARRFMRNLAPKEDV